MSLDGQSYVSTDEAAHACDLGSERRDNLSLLRVTGCLDWATVSAFRSAVRDLSPNVPVVIDLTEAKVDSAGTAGLLGAALEMSARDQRLVYVVSAPVELEVLRSMGIEQVAAISSSVDAATALLEATV